MNPFNSKVIFLASALLAISHGDYSSQEEAVDALSEYLASVPKTYRRPALELFGLLNFEAARAVGTYDGMSEEHLALQKEFAIAGAALLASQYPTDEDTIT